MYKAPIELIIADTTETTVQQVVSNLDEAIIRTVFECGVAVNNEELVRALNYDREQYQQGYEDGVRDMMEAQRWIPVTERLPKYNVDVLVYRPKMAMGIIVDSYDGFYGEDDNEWYEGWTRIVGCDNGEDEVTHWMPLPDAPKDGE